MSKYDKNVLEDLIINQKLSYECIGRMCDVSGNAIKKAAKRLGIELPRKRKINPSEYFNKGNKVVSRHCIQCGVELECHSKKYCSNKCQKDFIYNLYIKEWLKGNKSGVRGKYDISEHIRRYLFEKYNNSCQKCGWSNINVFSNRIPLQIHHKDGNCVNNKEDNLELLCPNCHSMTNTFGSLNGKSSRVHRIKK